MKAKKKPFDKYDYYLRAVQAPEMDCEFISDNYKALRGRRPRILREDFCGTFQICCEWVKADKRNEAIGIDLDPEPLAWGKEHNLSKLTPEQKARTRIVKGNVMGTKAKPADAIAALNFSYYLFKTRKELRTYFTKARGGLARDGIFVVDCFGGKACQEPNEERTRIEDFVYHWDQTSFNPVTHEALFHIHFKRKRENIRKKVFTYDWRMWTIPEIREIMMEAGFSKTQVYWEGTTRSGEGNGTFAVTEKGEECESWVAFIIAER